MDNNRLIPTDKIPIDETQNIKGHIKRDLEQVRLIYSEVRWQINNGNYVEALSACNRMVASLADVQTGCFVLTGEDGEDVPDWLCN